MKKIFLVGVALVLTACAQPKKEEPKSSKDRPTGTTEGQSSENKFDYTNLQFVWRWQRDPFNDTEGVMFVRFYIPSVIDGFLEPANVPGSFQLQLWMPDMGHGSVDTIVEHQKDPAGNEVVGAYKIRNIYFIMPGKWELRFQLVAEGAVRDTHTITLVREFR